MGKLRTVAGKLIPFEQVNEVSREEMERIWEKIGHIPEPVDFDFGDFGEYEVMQPTDDGKPRDHWRLLEEAYETSLAKFMWLRRKYPAGSFASIGMTSDPQSRDNYYNKFSKAFIRRDFFTPKLKLEEQILFRSNNKFNALIVEYALQHHLSEGRWKDEFAAMMNPQRRLLPHLQPYEPQPHFVYAKFSNEPANFKIDPSRH